MLLPKVTYSMAFRWMASAPNLPRPRNVSGGLWYTLASEPTSLSSCSKSCSDNVLFDIDITGLSDKTTACGKRLVRLINASQCSSIYLTTKNSPNKPLLNNIATTCSHTLAACGSVDNNLQ